MKKVKQILLFLILGFIFAPPVNGSIIIKNMKSIKKVAKWKIFKEFYSSKDITLKNGKVIFSFESENNNSIAKFLLPFKGVNLKGMSKLKIKVNNLTSDKLFVSFGFITSQGNKLWELPVKSIKKGENIITYDLTKSIYATAGNGWQYKDKISGEDKIIGFVMFIYPDKKMKGKISLDMVKIFIDTDIINKEKEEEKLYEIFEDFENNHPWKAALWSKASSVRYNYKYVTHGVRALQLNFSDSGEHVFYWYFDEPKKITFYDKLKMDIYVPEDNVTQLRINFFTGKNFKWHQSKYYPLSKGWNKGYIISISPDSFTPLLESTSITGIAIHIVSVGREKGDVVIDNIQLKRKKESIPISFNLIEKFKEMLQR